MNDREKIAHILRRFGFGASEAELDYYEAKGLAGTIDLLLNYEQVDEGWDLPLERFSNQQGQLRIQSAQAWWIMRMCVTKRPLQEKMTLFWHDHFATSAAKVDVPMAMFKQNEIIRAGATGRFQNLLTTVSKDPAMLYWLDNHYNVAGKPNENFAREVMELFTLGIGHYEEKDIQEASRAFTGWTFGVGPQGRKLDRITPRSRFLLRDSEHDYGSKTVLGNTGSFDGEDIFGILCGQEQTAKYIATKIWSWFAYLQPEPELINGLSRKFYENGLDIKKLLREVMESPAFYSQKAIRRVYKNPIDFTVSTIRQLGVAVQLLESVKDAETTEVFRRVAPVFVTNQASKSMGLELFYPPDVDGWPSGSAWISSATMVERIKWADRLFAPPNRTPGQRGPQSLRLPIFHVMEEDPTPMGVAKALTSLFDAPMTPAKLDQLAKAASDASEGSITPQNANTVAVAVCRLIFGAPEFQFC